MNQDSQKFSDWLEEYTIEYRWINNDVTCWIPFFLLDEFVLFFDIEVENDLKVHLQKEGIALDMCEICVPVGIDIDAVFSK